MVSYEVLRREFDKLSTKISSVLSLSDLSIKSNANASIEDVSVLFDKNPRTSTQICFSPSSLNMATITIYLNIPENVSKIVIVSSDQSGWENVKYYVSYLSGPTDSGTLSSIPMVGAQIPVNPNEKISKIELLVDAGESEYCFNVSNIYIYVAKTSVSYIPPSNVNLGTVEIKSGDSDTKAEVLADKTLAIAVKNTNGTRVDPATEQTLSDVDSKINTSNTKLASIDSKLVKADTDHTKIINTNGDAINPATEETLSNVYGAIVGPEYDSSVLHGGDVKSSGQSNILEIGNSKVLEVLIVTSNKTGSPSITFYVDVVEPISNAVIKTYPSETMSDAGVSYIRVANNLLGTYVRIRWDGTLDSSNYFSGVYVHVIGKR